MMSSTKSADGYAKLLNKSDCDKLKNVAKRPEVDKCEHLGWLDVFLLTHHVANFVLAPNAKSQASTEGCLGIESKFTSS
jgi:hypothetical protein